jgi:hypothetical protein
MSESMPVFALLAAVSLSSDEVVYRAPIAMLRGRST